MAVSKRTRYEVLRRDDHTCRYCGRRAPDVALTIDHVLPVALGGTDGPGNLVAACRDCNAGKSSSTPDAALVAQVTDDALRWSAAMQAAAAQAAARSKDARKYVDGFDTAWSRWLCKCRDDKGHVIDRDPDWRRSVRTWHDLGLPFVVLLDAVDIAMNQQRVGERGVWRYFCGVVWATVRDLQDDAAALL